LTLSDGAASLGAGRLGPSGRDPAFVPHAARAADEVKIATHRPSRLMASTFLSLLSTMEERASWRNV
jgi:hypothetical protein